MTQELTRDEKVFAARMLPYILAGDTLQQAAEKVVQRDRELYNALHANNDELYHALADSMVEDVYNGSQQEALCT